MDREIKAHGGVYSKLQVLQSNAGYFIGRLFQENGSDLIEPGSRESDYYGTREEAQKALDSGDFDRDCPEIDFLYESEEKNGK